MRWKNELLMAKKNSGLKNKELPRSAKAANVVQALASYCVALTPGAKVPTHTELMSILSASERAVRDALAQLQREGVIIRKNGVGTFVADISKRSGHTIIAIAQPDQSFFDRCMDLLYHRCEEADVTLYCRPTADAETALLPSGTSSLPPGYIFFGYQLASLAKRIQDQGNRVVIVGAPPADETPETPCIFNDHEHGGYLAAKHLIDLGHTRIAFCHSGAGELHRQRRWLGHLRAIREAERADIQIQQSLLMDSEVAAWQSEPQKAREYFDRDGAPTGLVAWNDHEAAKLLAALTRAGVKVPSEVSIVGYDALPEGRLVFPSLTTIDHGIESQIRTAVDMLTRTGPLVKTQTVVVVPNILTRESTAAPPQ